MLSPVLQWSKRVLRDAADDWEASLIELTGLPVVQLDSLTPSRVTIQVFADRPTAELLVKAFGGTINECGTVGDWIAASELPENGRLIRIRQRLLLTPETAPGRIESLQRTYPEKIILSVPAGLAFGTGDHATTVSCLRLLADEAERRVPGEWSLLDVGTGTAVLAMAARSLGAARCVGLENDAMAVETANRNLERNLLDRVELFHTEAKAWLTEYSGEPFSVITANLYSGVLETLFVDFARALRGVPEGVLIISGILRAQEEECLGKGREAGFVFDPIVRRGKWVTARGQLGA